MDQDPAESNESTIYVGALLWCGVVGSGRFWHEPRIFRSRDAVHSIPGQTTEQETLPNSHYNLTYHLTVIQEHRRGGGQCRELRTWHAPTG